MRYAGCWRERSRSARTRRLWPSSTRSTGLNLMLIRTRQPLRDLRQTYGTERADAIHLMLQMIRGGNLMGNSWDYVLHRLSFGRLGGADARS